MNYLQLKYFAKVAEYRSFSKAARQLNMTQPPLTMHINQLEKEIGARLFIRTARGVELTDVGGFLLRKVTTILRTTEIVEEELMTYIQQYRPTVKMLLYSSQKAAFLEEFLLPYKKTNPHIGLEIHEVNKVSDMTFLENGMGDFLIADSVPLKKFHPEVHQISEVPCCVAGVPSLFSTDEQACSLSQLSQLPLSAAYRVQDRLTELFRINNLDDHFELVSDDELTALQWAMTGSAAAVVSMSAARHLPACFTVRPLAFHELTMPMYLITNSAYYTSDEGMKMIDYILRHKRAAE